MSDQNDKSRTSSPEYVLTGTPGFHPIGEILPKMTAAEYKEHRDDVARNGLRDPLTMFEGLILDGRHRNNACLETGEPRRARDFVGTWDEAVEFVKSVNLTRRHLTTSQRAWAAGKLTSLPRGRRNSNPSNEGITSQTEAAEKLNVSVASVERAVKVQRKGIPELREAVESGEVSLNKAAIVASASPKDQKKFITNGRDASAKILKRLKINSLRGSKDGMHGCLRCDPDASFDLDNISANMQKIGFKAVAFAKANKTENFGPCFDSVVFEAEEIKLAAMKLVNSDKILAVIDRGTADGEKGLVWEGDVLQITRMSRVEYESALEHLIEYKIVQITFQEGKGEKARGAKKKLLSRTEPAKTKAPVMADDEPKEVYYDREW